jgi:hypothetical protein
MQYDIDLNALRAAERREVQFPDGITVHLNNHAFRFPAELPAAALDPLLSDKLDLLGLLADLARSQSGGTTWDMVEMLFKRPALPKNFLDAVYATYENLLGAEEYERFESVQPSVADYFRLTKALSRLYGVQLGKLFGLGSSSESDSETSSPTSADTTVSTPEESGSSHPSQDSSASVA